jgi:hypothetical protein
MKRVQVKTHLRVVVFSLLIATAIFLGVAGASFAAEPIYCSVGDFVWKCADGSETYLNAPKPPIPGHAGYGYFTSYLWSGSGAYGNENVQIPTDKAFVMRFKTTQKWVSWWDNNGEMHTEAWINGVVTIPSAAVIISIPGDIKGNFDITGWIKGKLVSTGEYVLASTTKVAKR